MESKHTLTEAETTAFSKMLDTLAEAQSNAGCNDFDMPDDAAFRKAVADYQNADDPDSHAQPRAVMNDFVVLAYLRDKLGL